MSHARASAVSHLSPTSRVGKREDGRESKKKPQLQDARGLEAGTVSMWG
jgi:hypothetical protein